MQLDSARELKAALQESVIVPMATSFAVRSAGLRAQPTTALAASPPTMALGVVRKGKHNFALAVRIQKRGLEDSPHLEAIHKKAKREVDIRYIDQPTRSDPSSMRSRSICTSHEPIDRGKGFTGIGAEANME